MKAPAITQPAIDLLHEQELTLEWIKLSGVLGLVGIAITVVMLTAPLPDSAAPVFAASFGPLLSLASYGLYRLLALNRKSASLLVAVVSNTIAGALVTAMLMIQLAVRSGGRGSVDDFLWTKFRRVDLGLDVAWDVYIALGTFLFAWNMLRHPRFGRIFGAMGILLAVGLAVLNLATFPTPPGNAGLVDLGPLVALWYGATYVQLLRSRRWAETRIGVPAAISDTGLTEPPRAGIPGLGNNNELHGHMTRTS